MRPLLLFALLITLSACVQPIPPLIEPEYRILVNTTLGATVSLDDVEEITNTQGTVEFTVPQGAYTLRASLDGYEPREVRIRILEDVEVDLMLTERLSCSGTSRYDAFLKETISHAEPITDSCDGSTLTEYRCNEGVQSRTIECPYGCSDGACQRGQVYVAETSVIETAGNPIPHAKVCLDADAYPELLETDGLLVNATVPSFGTSWQSAYSFGVSGPRDPSCNSNIGLSIPLADPFDEGFDAPIEDLRERPAVLDLSVQHDGGTIDASVLIEPVVLPNESTYEIVIIPLVPSGFEHQTICIANWTNNYGQASEGYTTVSGIGSCAEHEASLPGFYASFDGIDISTRSLFGNETITIENAQPTFDTDALGTVMIDPLTHVDEYWNELIGDLATPYGGSARFVTRVLEPIEADYALIADAIEAEGRRNGVRRAMHEIASENGIEPLRFDFPVFVYLDPDPNNAGFRAFASGRASYNFISSKPERIIENEAFLTVAHEFGHQAFDLQDLYSGYGLKDPIALPSNDPLPLETGCIMASGMAWKRNEQAIDAYEPTDMDAPDLDGLDAFRSTQSEHHVLCPDSLARISGASPDCSVSEYYANECDCADYRSCVE